MPNLWVMLARWAVARMTGASWQTVADGAGWGLGVERVGVLGGGGDELGELGLGRGELRLGRGELLLERHFGLRERGDLLGVGGGVGVDAGALLGYNLRTLLIVIGLGGDVEGLGPLGAVAVDGYGLEA